MLKPINSIIKDSIGNIIFRGNVVTGTVATDNGDGSYDVFISESDRAYPKIFTLSKNPNLAVGDKVRILYKNGCKELPIILPPVKATAIPSRYALITAYPNAFKLFDKDGNLLKSISNAGWSYGGCAITMDTQGNIYTEEGGETLKKYDSNFNLLVTQSIESGNHWFDSLNFGNDGFLYTLEIRAVGSAIAKRNATTLAIVEDVVTLNGNGYSGAFCLDSNGNFYIYNGGSIDKIEKWSSAGTKIADCYVGNMAGYYAGCGVCGDYVYFGYSSARLYYLPLSLSEYTVWNPGSAICYGITVADNHLIFSGWDGDGDGATSKYDSSRNLIWTKKLDPITSYAYKAGAYNF